MCIPGTTTGAAPDRLGSSGTANALHTAAIAGIAMANKNRGQPSACKSNFYA